MLKRKFGLSDRTGETGSPEPSSSQGRGLDVFGSSKRYKLERQELERQELERQELKSIATRLRPVKKFCGEKIADQNKEIAKQWANLGPADLPHQNARMIQITQIIQTKLPQLPT